MKLLDSDQAALEARIQANQQQWADAVIALNVDRIVECYAADGVLLGTVDNAQTGPRQGTEEITQYFNHFTDRAAIQPQFPEPAAQAIQPLPDGSVVASGYYTFGLEEHDGTQKVASAKFTYVYDAANQILLHNSGLTPEGIVNKV